MDKRSRRREQVLAGIKAELKKAQVSENVEHKTEPGVPFLAERTELLAKPLRGRGYYISSFAEYGAALSKTGARVLDLKFIDGPDHLRELFAVIQPDGTHSELWFDQLQWLSEREAALLIGIIKSANLRKVTQRFIEGSLKAVKSGELLAFRGSSAELADRIVMDGLVDSESLNRYFDYESYGAVLRTQLSKKEAGDMDDKELGEAWVEDVFGGIDEISDDLKRQHFDTECLQKELESCGLYQVKCAFFDWMVEPVAVQG